MKEKSKGQGFFRGIGVLEVLFLGAMLVVFLWVILGDYISVLALFGWAVIGLVVFNRRFHLQDKYALLGGCVFLFSLVMRLTVVAVIEPPPVSDFAVLLDASRQFAAGDYSFQDKTYFQRWAGQTGQVIYQGFLLRLWNDVLILKLVNCLAGAGTDLLIYLCGRTWFGPRAGAMAAALHGLAVFPLTLTAVLTNQIVAGFFSFLALYALVAPLPEGCSRFRAFLYRSVVKAPLAGVLVALANVARPDGLIVLTAVSAYFVFGLARDRNLAGLRRWCGGLALFWAGYVLVFYGISWVVTACGVNANGLSTGDPLLKLVYGLDQSSSGQYSTSANTRISEMVGQGIERTEAQRIILTEELQAGLPNLVDLFARKQNILWKGRGLGWALGHLKEHAYLYERAGKYDYFCAQGSLLLAGLGFVTIWTGKKPRPESLLPAFVVFAGFAAYLLIEVQPRYVYGLQPALYIMAAGGLEALARMTLKASRS